MAESEVDWTKCQERLCRGDPVACLELQRLITSILAQLRAQDFASEWEDLRQDVTMAVLTNARAGRLRDPQAFVGYVRIITRNKLFDRIKQRTRQRAHLLEAWDDETTRAALTPASHGPASPRARELWGHVERLPGEARALIEGVYGEGWTYQEMSARTGVPLGTLKRRLGRALRLLRDLLREDSEQ